MNRIQELKKLKADALVKLEQLANFRKEKGLSVEEEKNVTDLKTAIKAYNQEVEDLEFLETQKAQTVAVTTPTVPTNPEKAIPVNASVQDSSIKLEKGFHAAAYMRSLAAAKHLGESAIDFAKKAYGENHPVMKTLLAGSGSGANTVPTEIATEIIELLRNKTVIRQMVQNRIGVPHGKLSLPRQTGSVTASYVGENTALNATDLSIGAASLLLKKIMAVTSVTKEALAYSVTGMDRIIRDDLILALMTAEDAQMIRGTGSASAPKSLFDIATAASNTLNAAAGKTPNVAAVEVVLKDLIQKIEGGNVSTKDACWNFNSTVKNYLMFLRDANGNRAFPEMRDGLLLDKKFLDTEAIPGNLGAGADESEIYLTQPAGLYLGENNNMLIESTDVGSYQAAGALKSTFAEDSVAFKITASHDFEARHLKAVALAKQVQWGNA